MSAYATRQREQSARLPQVGTGRPGAELAAGAARAMLQGEVEVSSRPSYLGGGDGSAIDILIDRLVERVATAVVARLENGRADQVDEWFDSAQAAEYLGLHRDTLRRLAAARAIPTEQDGRGCKLFFRRSALDEWRRSRRPESAPGGARWRRVKGWETWPKTAPLRAEYGSSATSIAARRAYTRSASRTAVASSAGARSPAGLLPPGR